MTRLAILDPSERADQPMTWGDATIVFNGEIYNFVELRRELKSCGWSFETSGDTEVLLKALLQWGKGTLSRIRGMYAFLLWRGDRQELWAARDTFGIKPLYWATDGGGGTYFASEATALTELIGCTVAPSALSEFLHFGSPYSTTVFDGVAEMVPGVLSIWKADHSIETHSVDVIKPDATPVNELLATAVRSHLTSDRPVALFLSGGFDSALVASQVAPMPNPPTGITIDTGDNSADVSGARRTAAHYGLALEVVSRSPNEIGARVEGYLRSMDQPTIDGFNTFLVSDAANTAGFPVALSGLGGDEVLGGYGYYRRAHWMARAGGPYRKFPTRARSYVDRVVAAGTGRTASQVASMLSAQTTLERYQAWRCVFTADEVERLTGLRPPLPTVSFDDSKRDVRRELQTLDFEMYLRKTILRDVDVFSMACGVEVRVPLLDRPFVNHMITCLPSYRKPDMASVSGDLYLAEVAARKKLTFRLPWHDWVETVMPSVEFLGGADPWHGFVDPSEARALLRSSQDGPVDRLLALVVLARWLKDLGTPRRIERRPV